MDKQIWMDKFLKKIIFYLIVNRILFFIAIYLLVISFPFQKASHFGPIFDFILTFGKRWDGNSYTFIAKHGYVLTGSEKNFIVFPPFYPLLIKLLTTFNINYVLSGILISNFFFVAGMITFYKLLILDYDKKFSTFVIVLISIFPTSFFFSVAYPESLFLFLFVLSFYLSRKRSYLYSGFLGGLAAITRPFGLAIYPALFLQILINKNLNVKNFLLFTIPFIVPSSYYLLVNYFLFSDPLAFQHFLKENWQKSFAFPWKGILDSWKRGIFTTQLNNYKFLVGYGEAIASTLAWLSILLGIKYWKLKSSYLAYLFLATILFTSTGFILSAPRYLLSVPPFFIILAKVVGSNKILKTAWVILSTVLLFYIAYEFAWGQWTF